MIATTPVRLPHERPSAILLDLDGTALRSDGRFATATRSAVRDAVDAGVPVAIVTGRSERQALALASDLGLVEESARQGRDAYVVSALGGVTTDARTNRVIDQRTIDPATAQSVVSYAQSHGDDLAVVGVHDQIARDGTPSASTPFADGHAPDLLARTHDATLIRVTGTTAAQDLQRLVDPRKAQIRVGHSLGFEQVEIAPPHTDNGTASRMLLARLHADPAHAIAIGDTDVDVPMFRAVADSVAMGNAGDAIKHSAAFVTTSNNADGVALAIETALRPEWPAVGQPDGGGSGSSTAMASISTRTRAS